MNRRAIAAIAALMLLAPAFAEARAAEDSRAQAAERVPSAQLQASGDGVVVIGGRMAIAGNLPARGAITVIDRAGDAELRVAGEPVRFVRRRARVRNASGLIMVTGSKVTVTVRGDDLSLSIAGHGTARLSGTGVYRLNGGPEQSWRRATVKVEPSRDRGRRGPSR